MKLIILCIIALVIGMLIGATYQQEQNREEIELLTGVTQEQFWTIGGLEQEVKTYEWELDLCRTVELEIDWDKE